MILTQPASQPTNQPDQPASQPTNQPANPPPPPPPSRPDHGEGECVPSKYFMRAGGSVTYARGLSKSVCFHDDFFFQITRVFTLETPFFKSKFQFYLEKTLM